MVDIAAQPSSNDTHQSTRNTQFREAIEGQDFYELCQTYRWANHTDFAGVSAAFDALKEYIIKSSETA